MQLSFEFFPPRTAKGEANLLGAARRLAELNPEYVSVTCGAGGTGQPWAATAKTVAKLRDAGLNAIPHMVIGGDDCDGIKRQLDAYLRLGVTHLIALRGDAPQGAKASQLSAETLVRRIRRHCGDGVQVQVAGYPEVHPAAASPAADLASLKRKVQAGADGIITQYFFNLAAYLHFREQAQASGIEAPITPGIMPLTNFHDLVRFSDGCGADIPRWIHKHLEAYQNDAAALHAFGVAVVTELCAGLLAAGAPGLHFYTLNRAAASAQICANLGLQPGGSFHQSRQPQQSAA